MLYEYLRPGEGRVLDWETDVDFVTSKIHVSKAWSYEDACVKPTKTWETRDVPIEPTLLPLLKAMHNRAKGKGLVLPILSELTDELRVSRIFRSHLEAAGVTRPGLFPSDDPVANTRQIATRSFARRHESYSSRPSASRRRSRHR
jgi:hypothetical protein